MIHPKADPKVLFVRYSLLIPRRKIRLMLTYSTSTGAILWTRSCASLIRSKLDYNTKGHAGVGTGRMARMWIIVLSLSTKEGQRAASRRMG